MRDYRLQAVFMWLRSSHRRGAEGVMMKYIVTNIYKYTATVEVEADSESEAKNKALGMEDERNNDDYLYDSTARKAEEG